MPAAYISEDLHLGRSSPVGPRLLAVEGALGSMIRSLAALCLEREGALRLTPIPDRRQCLDRRYTVRGGRRKDDIGAADQIHAEVKQPVTVSSGARG